MERSGIVEGKGVKTPLADKQGAERMFATVARGGPLGGVEERFGRK